MQINFLLPTTILLTSDFRLTFKSQHWFHKQVHSTNTGEMHLLHNLFFQMLTVLTTTQTLGASQLPLNLPTWYAYWDLTPSTQEKRYRKKYSFEILKSPQMVVKKSFNLLASTHCPNFSALQIHKNYPLGWERGGGAYEPLASLSSWNWELFCEEFRLLLSDQPQKLKNGLPPHASCPEYTIWDPYSLPFLLLLFHYVTWLFIMLLPLMK